MNRSRNKLAWAVTLIYLPLLVLICTLMQGCATTGAVPAEIIQQSAAVDTSISDLQSQQATSSESVQAVSDTAAALEQTAVTVDNPVLTKQVATLKAQVKTLSSSLKAERDKTSQIQSDYSAYKVSSGTEITDQSSKLNKLTAKLALTHKWIWILAVTLAVLILGSICGWYIKLKLKWF
jgi:hypothetical protein